MDVQDTDGKTRLMGAAFGGHVDVVGLLLKAGQHNSTCTNT